MGQRDPTPILADARSEPGPAAFGVGGGPGRAGELTAQWRPAFEAVARHEFVPNTVYELDRSVDGPDLVPLRREDDPRRWLAIAYANGAVNSQVDDGQPDEHGRGRELTSSASQPAVVAEMLAALQVEPGMRVLEIGTGTGYNAALLAHRLGPENVVSVEVDPAVAEHARARLAAQGYVKVTVITGDGAADWAGDAPYDRVLATVAARSVPHAWVSQTRPGGQVLVPWGSEWYPASLLALDVDTDGVGHGRIVGSASFMTMRSQRASRWAAGEMVGSGADVTITTTELHPWRVAGCPDSATAIGFRVPGVQQFYLAGEDRPGRFNLVDQASRSWARVTVADAPPYPVEQAGPRRLFDEIAQAYQWWLDVGEPAIGRWLVVVGPDGQRIELDST